MAPPPKDPQAGTDPTPPSPPSAPPPVSHTQETTVPVSSAAAAPRFGLATLQSGDGAPIRSASDEPPAPSPTDWASRALQASQEKGRFAGRTTAQWQRLVEREAAWAAGEPQARIVPPVVSLGAEPASPPAADPAAPAAVDPDPDFLD